MATHVYILMGAPGCGKGTQSKKLSQFLKIPHISSGDLFRQHIKQESDLGKQANLFIQKGNLVPDDIVSSMMIDQLSQDTFKQGCILDGFPRSIKQAETLNAFFKKQSLLYSVLNLEISQDNILKRLTSRLTCNECGLSYKKKDKKNYCDVCNSKLITRPDDYEEVIINRINNYHHLTSPLIDYYKKHNKLYMVNAEESEEVVFDNIIKTINTQLLHYTKK